MVGNIIVILIVLAAVFFSGRKLYKTLTGKSGCGCGCGSSKENNAASCGCSGCSVKH